MLPKTGTLLSPHAPSANAYPSANAHSKLFYPWSLKNRDRPENCDDRMVLKQWRLGFFALYAAVALLLVGLAIADQPGTVTIASARLGQANATIRYQQTSKSSDPSGTTACRRLTC
ncbi:hypothetical protein [Bradyrhizobium sp. Ash2021]|uniref:hypothetical protein n=1 Tax=Bradyrhizobium sp. Ash2021 TaxID=2954771 RepID=UPI0028153339|nr:hypothetical protein [Bradyrhizobium sp. Ash2021]WMT73429.1 hypothetical protein NL528_36615 [Bradyrhizobium sp. Ash2021]